MTHHHYFRWFFAGFYLSTALGCAYPISKELREEVNKNLTFPMVLESPTAYVGSIVIWGGEIVKTNNLKDSTEILVLDTPLDYEGVPEDAAFSRGRFIARSARFLDPALYKAGSKITIAGEIIGKETRPLGKTAYTYPVIAVKQLHLWKSPSYSYYYPNWFYYGFYGGPYVAPYPFGFYGDFDRHEEYEEHGEHEEEERGER